MTKTFTQAAALVLAAVLTLGTFVGANAMASHQYAAAASEVAVAQTQQAAQHVATVSRHGVNA